MIYFKPLVPISLIILHLQYVKKVSYFFLLAMLVILVTDVFTYIDFLEYYEFIALLIALFYACCIVSLRKYIARKDIVLKKLLSPPVVVSVLLISYLVYSITELVLPKIENSVGSIAIIVVSLVSFVGVCFFIYTADRFEKSVFLFIAACCTLFVDALLAVNELYYYTRVFTTLINIAEIAGLYFFTSFFIETKPLTTRSLDKEFF
ncbi:hypothetical protein M0D21_20625 [Aquimarina sp. D1M17]|uniref:hypothetical protein n=1 Tax=Aquimarina acroporae TaxID=2937283 RepID=UPI0020C18999|nr:hypothetical protein [Aquimarina acroporae]MCK8523994.1 hypothetical protein [Aquimarina acroporae]